MRLTISINSDITGEERWELDIRYFAGASKTIKSRR